mmetsp:Transcript_1319/g.2830  ORF Transcript_1319/g.2830 Transcript_1319/m.2830 type:complete len:218 (-) Transcript_1319:364-1017(-)
MRWKQNALGTLLHLSSSPYAQSSEVDNFCSRLCLTAQAPLDERCCVGLSSSARASTSSGARFPTSTGGTAAARGVAGAWRVLCRSGEEVPAVSPAAPRPSCGDEQALKAAASEELSSTTQAAYVSHAGGRMSLALCSACISPLLSPLSSNTDLPTAKVASPICGCIDNGSRRFSPVASTSSAPSGMAQAMGLAEKETGPAKEASAASISRFVQASKG